MSSASHGTFTVPGMTHFSTQAGVRESITIMDASPSLMALRKCNTSSSATVFTPGASSLGWMQKDGYFREVRAYSGSMVFS